MSDLVSGAVAVVTGGASGVGRAIAHRLAQEGAAGVVIADLRADPREGGPTTAELVKAAGSQAAFVPCDVRSPEDLASAVSAADVFGGVTVMVNNAGIFHSGDFLGVTEETYIQVMDVNLKGTFFGAQAAARSMTEGDRTGSIINLSSTGGVRGDGNYSVYNASKGAVRLLTYSLAGSLGPRGVRVNALHPGIIATEMTRTDSAIANERTAELNPLRRNGVPQDVAGAAAFLASPLADYVNGASLIVDGGMSFSK